MTVGLEMLGSDCKLFARDVEDRPLLGSLRDFDVGFRIGVLGGGDRGLGGGGLGRRHASLVPMVSLALAANSPAAILGPSAVFTRKILIPPAAPTAVKASAA